MKRSIILCMYAMMAAICSAQHNIAKTSDAQLIQNVSSRHTVSLDGDWRCIVDPYNHGFYHRFQLDLKFDGNMLSDYDFDTSPTLRVPGDWNTQRPELMNYEGRVWYRTKFDYKPAEGKRLFLHFSAANYIAQVWLNGKELGRHEGGFTPFEYEITGQTKAEGNSLVVCVDDTRLPGGIPTLNTDWWNYGGLTRSVCLVETDKLFIKDYSIQLSRTDSRKIEGYVQLSDKAAKEAVTLQIPELKVKTQLTTDENGRATFTLKAKPKLWTPESPKLYNVNITHNGETVTDNIGFRTIATAGNKILLNGKEIFLCGVNIHEESVGDAHRCITAEEDSVLLALAKDMGCNFVRLAHYPHNEDMIRMADKMGLMVWSEIPLYWGIDWNSKETYALAEQQLGEMISRDHNRASIIIWSIANETAVNNERTAFLTKLANKTRQLDDTRLVSAALQNVNKRLAPTVYTVEDPLKDALDIFSYNEYIGWYDAPKEFCDSITWQLNTDKPVVISEFGGGAKHFTAQDNVKNAVTECVRNNPKAFFNEDNQAELYRHQFTMLRKIPGLAGTIPWVLTDFRSPHRLLEGVQDGFNRKGLYTDKGEKKKAWQIVKDWNDEHRNIGRTNSTK